MELGYCSLIEGRSTITSCNLSAMARGSFSVVKFRTSQALLVVKVHGLGRLSRNEIEQVAANNYVCCILFFFLMYFIQYDIFVRHIYLVGKIGESLHS